MHGEIGPRREQMGRSGGDAVRGCRARSEGIQCLWWMRCPGEYVRMNRKGPRYERGLCQASCCLGERRTTNQNHGEKERTMTLHITHISPAGSRIRTSPTTARLLLANLIMSDNPSMATTGDRRKRLLAARSHGFRGLVPGPRRLSAAAAVAAVVDAHSIPRPRLREVMHLVAAGMDGSGGSVSAPGN